MDKDSDQEVFDAVVVGSGPSGFAAAQACIRRGWRTLVIDDAEPSSSSDLGKITFDAIPKISGEPLPKPHLGRYEVYGVDPSHRVEKSFLVRARAFGGFSMVWGAAVLPIDRKWLKRWGIPLDDWLISERTILKCFKLLGSTQIWGQAYESLQSCTCEPLIQSTLFVRLLDHVAKRAHRLRSRGLRLESSLIAVNSQAQDCTGCELCMTGCPTDTIMNSANLFRQMDSPLLCFASQIHIISVKKESEQSYILLTSSSRRHIKAQRVFLAGGVLGSAEILMNSKGLANVRIKDSQYFLFPAVTFFKTKASDIQIALAQAFLEVEKGGSVLAHFQLYDLSIPYFVELLSNRYQKIPGAKTVLRIFHGRLILLQGCLPSSSSGTIDIVKQGQGLRISGQMARGTWAFIAAVFFRLLRNWWSLGFLSIPIFKIALPGQGFHAGSSFPMRVNPGSGETSMGGELGVGSGIYLVDSSVFPEIPAMPPTFSVMVNADRIVRHAK